MSGVTWYMATGKNNQTGPIEKNPGKAARKFFALYPNETECYVNAGDRLSGTELFFAHLGKEQFEMTKEMLFG
jgi:hypothetical protein